MMFQGRSVISAVWGVGPGAGTVPGGVPAAASREPASQPVWSVFRLFRRQARRHSEAPPRLPVPSPDPKNGRNQH